MNEILPRILWRFQNSRESVGHPKNAVEIHLEQEHFNIAPFTKPKDVPSSVLAILSAETNVPEQHNLKEECCLWLYFRLCGP